MTRTRTPRQTVVVGAGIAGLVAAIRSAGLGGAVTLLEQAAHPGGRARTQRREGFSLNLGPHALYERGHLMGVLRWLKLPAPGTKPPQSGWLERGGTLHALPGDARTFFGTTALTGAADRFGLIRRLTGAALPEVWRGRPVSEWLSESLSEQDSGAAGIARALIRVSTYADAPNRQEAGAALLQLQRALLGGVRYLDGGWGAVIDAMMARAVELGVTVRSSEEVEEVAPGSVRTAQGTYPAERVVLAVPPVVAARLLEAQFPAYAAAARALEPVRAACLDVCLSALPAPGNRFVLGMDRPDYLSVHSESAALAPPGGALIHVARYLGGQPPPDRAVMEALLDRYQPGWRAVLVHARWMPELTVCGALDRLDRPRPPGATAEMRAAGIFCAGDWVASAGMLADAAADTGWTAGGGG